MSRGAPFTSIFGRGSEEERGGLINDEARRQMLLLRAVAHLILSLLLGASSAIEIEIEIKTNPTLENQIERGAEVVKSTD